MGLLSVQPSSYSVGIESNIARLTRLTCLMPTWVSGTLLRPSTLFNKGITHDLPRPRLLLPPFKVFVLGLFGLIVEDIVTRVCQRYVSHKWEALSWVYHRLLLFLMWRLV